MLQVLKGKILILWEQFCAALENLGCRRVFVAVILHKSTSDIDVAGDDTEANETGGSKDCRQLMRLKWSAEVCIDAMGLRAAYIAKKLRVVILYDRTANKVSPWGKPNDSRRGCA